MVAKKKDDSKKVKKSSASSSAEKKIVSKATSKKSVAGSTKKVAAEKIAIKKLKKEVNEVKNSNNEESNANKVIKNNDKKPFVISKNKINNEGKIGVVENGFARATGKRKRSIAKVICKEKNGNLSISVNDKDYKNYFTKLIHQDVVYSPFAILGINSGFVVRAEVFGGGKTGQADALKLGLSRCLTLLSEEYGRILRKNSFLTRDSRIVEPKKYGLKKARKKEQFSKR